MVGGTASESELQRLRRLEREHALILEAAGEGIYGFDREGRGTFVNTAARQILGWTSEDLAGQITHDLHHHTRADGSPYPREECPIYAALSDGAIHRVDDEVFWHKDGHCIPVEYISTPIWESGEIQGAVVVFRDITARKHAEEKLRCAYAEIAKLKDSLERERDYLREEVNVAHNFGEIVGESAALQGVLSRIEAVAETTANVLILGESGTGKELVARAIHRHSDRAEGPLIKVNCPSIPKDLFESEFFGHVKGAFTGAHRKRIGRFELAHGGTLFLDEVSEIPIDLQGKLLRALQEREFERVGEEQTRKVNVRVVAASNRDLHGEMEAGRFRRDLYYRLNVFPIEVPPLRERREDILPLASRFLESSARDFGVEPPKLSRAQAEQLMAYRWPGNVRELQNVIERALILSKGGPLRLDLEGTTRASGKPPPMQDDVPGEDREILTEKELQQQERRNLVAALERTNWQVAGPGGAAELLGVKPTTLNYRMKTYGIRRPADRS